MKYCQNCGAKIEENIENCPYCGHPTRRVVEENVPRDDSPVMGILAIVFGALGGWLGIVFGIIGLTMYKEPKNRKNCKIGIGLFVGWIVLWVIIIVAVVITGMGAISNMAFLPLQ